VKLWHINRSGPVF